MHQILIHDWIGIIIIRGRHVELFCSLGYTHAITPFALYKKRKTTFLFTNIVDQKSFEIFSILFPMLYHLIKSLL